MENTQEEKSSHVKKSILYKFIFYRIIFLSDILFNLSYNRAYILHSKTINIFSLFKNPYPNSFLFMPPSLFYSLLLRPWAHHFKRKGLLSLRREQKRQSKLRDLR